MFWIITSSVCESLQLYRRGLIMIWRSLEANGVNSCEIQGQNSNNVMVESSCITSAEWPKMIDWHANHFFLLLCFYILHFLNFFLILSLKPASNVKVELLFDGVQQRKCWLPVAYERGDHVSNRCVSGGGAGMQVQVSAAADLWAEAGAHQQHCRAQDAANEGRR